MSSQNQEQKKFLFVYEELLHHSVWQRFIGKMFYLGKVGNVLIRFSVYLPQVTYDTIMPGARPPWAGAGETSKRAWKTCTYMWSLLKERRYLSSGGGRFEPGITLMIGMWGRGNCCFQWSPYWSRWHPVFSSCGCLRIKDSVAGNNFYLCRQSWADRLSRLRNSTAVE